MTAPTPYQSVKFIERLKDACARAPYNAAVCDMLGRRYQDNDGQIKEVTVFSPLSVRYKLRSRPHVNVYGFDTIHTNY